MAAITELCAAGKIIPVIDRHYSLQEVPEGLRYVGEGRHKGKVVITIFRELFADAELIGTLLVALPLTRSMPAALAAYDGA